MGLPVVLDCCFSGCKSFSVAAKHSQRAVKSFNSHSIPDEELRHRESQLPKVTQLGYKPCSLSAESGLCMVQRTLPRSQESWVRIRRSLYWPLCALSLEVLLCNLRLRTSPTVRRLAVEGPSFNITWVCIKVSSAHPPGVLPYFPRLLGALPALQCGVE